jgi:hypothetical protein
MNFIAFIPFHSLPRPFFIYFSPLFRLGCVVEGPSEEETVETMSRPRGNLSDFYYIPNSIGVHVIELSYCNVTIASRQVEAHYPPFTSSDFSFNLLVDEEKVPINTRIELRVAVMSSFQETRLHEASMKWLMDQMWKGEMRAEEEGPSGSRPALLLCNSCEDGFLIPLTIEEEGEIVVFLYFGEKEVGKRILLGEKVEDTLPMEVVLPVLPPVESSSDVQIQEPLVVKDNSTTNENSSEREAQINVTLGTGDSFLEYLGLTNTEKILTIERDSTCRDLFHLMVTQMTKISDPYHQKMLEDHCKTYRFFIEDEGGKRNPMKLTDKLWEHREARIVFSPMVEKVYFSVEYPLTEFLVNEKISIIIEAKDENGGHISDHCVRVSMLLKGL